MADGDGLSYVIETSRDNLTPGQIYELLGYQKMADADLVVVRHDGRLKAVKNRQGQPGYFPEEQVPDNAIIVKDE